MNPILQLLFKAVLWMPAAIFLMLLVIASWIAVVLLPIMAAVMLYTDQYPFAAAYLGAGILAFFSARFLTKKFWEEPPSLL